MVDCLYNDSSYYKKIMELKGYQITEINKHDNDNDDDSIFDKVNGLIGRTITSK